MVSNEIRGRRAERFVARRFDLNVVPDQQARWYDAINPRTGAKYEVKSSKSGGMFRFWRDQHRRLSGANANGTAWYALVRREDGQPVEMRRVEPSTVTKVVNDRGGWNEPVHRREAKQKKVPIGVFLG